LYLIGRKWQKAGEDCIMRSFITYAPKNIGVVKSRRMRLAGHVARMGEMRNVYNISVEK
jgi:hypothetical protein